MQEWAEDFWWLRQAEGARRSGATLSERGNAETQKDPPIEAFRFEFSTIAGAMVPCYTYFEGMWASGMSHPLPLLQIERKLWQTLQS